MRHAASFIAFLLVTVWLPATQRCELVAAGMVSSTVAQDDLDCGCPPGVPCRRDNCQVLEQFLTLPASDQLAVVGPELVLCTCHIDLRSLDSSPRGGLAVGHKFLAALPELPRPWQFQRRAALPPRLPSLV